MNASRIYSQYRDLNEKRHKRMIKKAAWLGFVQPDDGIVFRLPDTKKERQEQKSALSATAKTPLIRKKADLNSR